MQFCKRYLQVHNKAFNIACRAELGKFPMINEINKKILNYLDYLIGKDEDSKLNRPYKFQLALDCTENAIKNSTDLISLSITFLNPKFLGPIFLNLTWGVELM